MKRIGIIILLTAIIMTGASLNIQAETSPGKERHNPTGNDSTNPSIMNNLKVAGVNDSLSNSDVRNNGLSILESLEVPGIISGSYSHHHHDWDQEDNENDYSRRSRRFRGHWTGIEFGFNNYATSNKSLSLPADIDYMTLHSGKSNNFNINFSQLSLGLSRHIGFVTGLGLNWNNYRFDGNNNIEKGPDGVIQELVPVSALEKSKLTTLYLTLPFMLELQIPAHHNHLTIAGGPIGALKLGSHTKMVFEDGQKIKSNGDFSLNLLRYGATARVGYGNFMLYGTYYMTPLFRTGKAPGNVDLFPFEIGIALTFNN